MLLGWRGERGDGSDGQGQTDGSVDSRSGVRDVPVYAIRCWLGRRVRIVLRFSGGDTLDNTDRDHR